MSACLIVIKPQFNPTEKARSKTADWPGSILKHPLASAPARGSVHGMRYLIKPAKLKTDVN